MKVVVDQDIWDYPADIVIVTTCGVIRNDGKLTMGKGIALQAALRYPFLPSRFGLWVQQYGNQCYLTGADEVNSKYIMSFPTKHHWRDKSDINLIRQSCIQAVHILNNMPNRQLYTAVLPPPGCGCGQLAWNEVYPVISEILSDDFTCIIPSEFLKE